MGVRDEMEKIGGPAFPQVWDDKCGTKTIWHGISARDYFAAAAMQGLCASFDGPCLDDAFVSGVARRAFDVADAMLDARKPKEGSNG
jgi:hypothetical protein